MLKFIKHKDIDRNRWDLMASNSQKAYFSTWYLDAVSPGWDALVWGEYEHFMPLTYIKKYGVKIMIQPPFCQQTGVMNAGAGTEIEAKFCKYVKRKFIWSYWQGNSKMKLQGQKQKENYILQLKNEYKSIQEEYSHNHKKNIKKYLRSGSYIKPIDQERSFEFIQEFARFEISNKSWDVLQRIMDYASKENKLECIASLNKELVEAVSVFIWEGQTVLHIASASNESGYEHSAQYGIIDFFITQNASRHIVLDFEGSSIESIAYFYQGFSAKKESYPCFKHSIIPFL